MTLLTKKELSDKIKDLPDETPIFMRFFELGAGGEIDEVDIEVLTKCAASRPRIVILASY